MKRTKLFWLLGLCLCALLAVVPAGAEAGGYAVESIQFQIDRDGEGSSSLYIVLDAEKDCSLVTASYNEKGAMLECKVSEIRALDSGSWPRYGVDVDLDIDRPDAAQVKAFLVDGGTFRPLCACREKTVTHIYTVKDDEAATLTFYNTLPQGVSLSDWNVSRVDEYTETPWRWERGNPKTVIFAEPIAPVSTAYWFAGCQDLTRIEHMENLDTGRVTDMNHMFDGCTSLEALDVSGWNTAQVRDMGYLFNCCYSLEALDVSGWNTAQVRDMEYLFNGCTSLEALDVSRWNTAQVQDMGYLFDGCSGLTTLDVSRWNTARVTDMGGLFAGCYGLTDLDVSRWNTAQATDMNGLFDGCAGLTRLDLSGWNTSKVTNMSSMFGSCTNLTECSVSGFDTGKVKNMYGMFQACGSLTALDLSRWNTARVTDMGSMFYRCEALTRLDVHGFDTSAVTSMESMFYECRSLTSLDVSGFRTSNVTDMRGLFGHCYALTDLDISGFDTARVTDMEGMFDGCWKVANLDVSGFDTALVTKMGHMFSGCRSVKELDVSGFDTARVTDMCGMFWKCEGLTGLDLTGFDTGAVTDMRYMFCGCDSLTSLELSSFHTAKVTQMGNMFSYSGQLTGIYVSNQYVTGAVTDNGEDMFRECYSLQGGNGTRYDADHNDLSYARVDREEAPGYFRDSPLSNIGYAHLHLQAGGNYGSLSFTTARSHGGLADVWCLDCWPLKEQYTAEDLPPWHEYADRITSVSVCGRVSPVSTAYWFDGCSNLFSVFDLSNLDTGRLTDMTAMFRGCSILPRLELGGLDTGGVTAMAGLFDGCSALTAVEVSTAFTTGALTDGGQDMFRGCVKLTGGSGTVYDPGHTDAAWARIDSSGAPGYFTQDLYERVSVYAVLSRDGTTLTFYNTRPDSVPRSDPNIWEAADTGSGAPPWYGCRKSIRSVVFAQPVAPRSMVGWFADMTAAFSGLENLDTSQVRSMAGLFSGCHGISGLDLSGWSTGNVTSMADMFRNSDLTRLDARSWDLSGVTSLRGMFAGCSNLTQVNLSGCETGAVTDMTGMFYRCVDLQTAGLGELDARAVKSLRQMFYGCWKLRNPDLSGFRTEQATDMSAMFSHCSALTELDLRGFDTGRVVSMNDLFSGCAALETIRVSSDFVMDNVTGTNAMFDGCAALFQKYLKPYTVTLPPELGGPRTEQPPIYTDGTYARLYQSPLEPGFFCP